jgi:hypothetical protein
MSTPPKLDDSYCPYCNSDKKPAMTDEHIIPQSIGGAEGPRIRVCKDCNDITGGRIDTLILEYPVFRLLLGELGRQEKHETTVTLKDGREIEGYSFWRQVGGKQVTPTFSPKKTQKDGSIWLSEHVVSDPTRLPKGYNVLYEDMIDWIPYSPFKRPKDCSFEPFMVKVLLGFLYLIHGRSVIEQPAFDIFRRCLRGKVSRKIGFHWLNKIPHRWADLNLPDKYNGIVVAADCTHEKRFKALVSLHHTLRLHIEVSNFGACVPERFARIDRSLPYWEPVDSPTPEQEAS